MQDEKVFRLARAGVTIEVIEYGARLKRCLVPDRHGVIADVVPGFDRSSDYMERGGTIGAVLGRYGNRIGYGRIRIHDTTYQLSRNDGDHTMHGGAGHFGTRWWRGAFRGPHSAVLELTSENGDQGWPGEMRAWVAYTLTDQADLVIQMSAVCDQDTYVNMLFHGYWNLGGHASGSVADHLLNVAADRYTPKGDDGLPTGELRNVADGPFDFRTPKRLGADLAATGRGYAHNLCLRGYQEGHCRPVAWLLDPVSGRALILETDQPGLQIFTANSWSNLSGKDGAVYQAHSALALESQQYPNTPNTPSFAPKLLRAGATYNHRMVVKFRALGTEDLDTFFNG